MAQAVNLLVDLSVFFDISVGVGDVGLGLVIVIVRNKIVHGGGREKVGVFLGELSGQCFIVRDNECRPSNLSDDIGASKSFARAGHAEQGLMAFAFFHPRHQFGNRLRLVARRPERRF